MGNLNIAVIGPQGYGRNLGKKGTSSDITMYNLKSGENTLTLIEPTRWPERIQPLFYALSMADYALIVVEEIDAALGEAIIAADSMGLTKGGFILHNYHQPEEIRPLIKGTSLEDYEFLDEDFISLREKFLGMAANERVSDGPGTVAVDHFFNVRGVGTVVLGIVKSGTIRKHDDVNVLPAKKRAQIRSIQKHDDDFTTASVGDRVGLALKNITVDDLHRGDVITTDDIPLVSGGRLNVEMVKFWKTPLREGMVIHLGHWMQIVPARIEAIDNDSVLEVKLEKSLVLPPGDDVLVMFLDGQKLRVVGSGRFDSSEV